MLIACHTRWNLACPGHLGLVAWVRLKSMIGVASPCVAQRSASKQRAAI